MTRSQFPIRRTYPIAAIVVALCLGASPAMAEPKDQTPFIKPPASANVYVPPAELSGQQDARSPDAVDAAEGRLPGPSDSPATTDVLPRPVSTNANDPWAAIGLAAGGFVLLCGSAFAIHRMRRTRRRVA